MSDALKLLQRWLEVMPGSVLADETRAYLLAATKRAEAAEQENAILREMVELMTNIPNMTNEQLAQLIANARAAAIRARGEGG